MWPVDYDGNPLDEDKRNYYPPMSFWKGNKPISNIETLSDQAQITKQITELSVDFIERNKMTLKPINNGWIEVICGNMFSGKTEELIRRLIRAQIAKQVVTIFKPSLDDRYSEDYIVSHNKRKIKSLLNEKKPRIFPAKISFQNCTKSESFCPLGSKQNEEPQ